MVSVYLYPILPAIIFGTLNWLYWRKQGYTSIVQLGMGIMLFYAGLYLVIKKVYF
ncbi:MAG: hypothetical protein COA33_001360 [Fluviicola sp.]|nr:hypothetical protein [Fluviicola sp.]